MRIQSMLEPLVAAAVVSMLSAFGGYVSYATAAEGRWQKTASGCLVWDALPQPDETVAWSGGCEEGKASGHGTEFYRYRGDGVWKEERYVGEMRDGKLDGSGTLTYDNGDRYQGRFVDGRRSGRGTYTHANGDRYEGEFKEDMRTGSGIFVYHTGGRYEGEFLNGEYQGHGTFYFANGDRYEGDFAGGLPDGFGSFTAHTGESVRGHWSNGCLRQGNRVAAAGVPKEKCKFE